MRVRCYDERGEPDTIDARTAPHTIAHAHYTVSVVLTHHAFIPSLHRSVGSWVIPGRPGYSQSRSGSPDRFMSRKFPTVSKINSLQRQFQTHDLTCGDAARQTDRKAVLTSRPFSMSSLLSDTQSMQPHDILALANRFVARGAGETDLSLLLSAYLRVVGLQQHRRRAQLHPLQA